MRRWGTRHLLGFESSLAVDIRRRDSVGKTVVIVFLMLLWRRGMILEERTHAVVGVTHHSTL
jgi:hypothetical protein